MPICAVAMAKEFGWSKSETGIVLGAFFWGYCFTQVLGGHASDRWVFWWRVQVVDQLWKVEVDDDEHCFLQDRRRESTAAVHLLLGRDDGYHSASGQHWTPTSCYHDRGQVSVGCNARWEHCERQLGRKLWEEWGEFREKISLTQKCTEIVLVIDQHVWTRNFHQQVCKIGCWGHWL